MVYFCGAGPFSRLKRNTWKSLLHKFSLGYMHLSEVLRIKKYMFLGCCNKSLACSLIGAWRDGHKKKKYAGMMVAFWRWWWRSVLTISSYVVLIDDLWRTWNDQVINYYGPGNPFEYSFRKNKEKISDDWYWWLWGYRFFVVTKNISRAELLHKIMKWSKKRSFVEKLQKKKRIQKQV